MKHVCEEMVVGRPGALIARCKKTVRGVTPELSRQYMTAHKEIAHGLISSAKRRRQRTARQTYTRRRKEQYFAPVAAIAPVVKKPVVVSSEQTTTPTPPVVKASRPTSLWARIKSALRIN